MGEVTAQGAKAQKASLGSIANASSGAPQGSNGLVHKKQLSTEGYTVVKRNGMIIPFRRNRIERAIEAAFRASFEIATDTPLPQAMHSSVQLVADAVISEALALSSGGDSLTVEKIQDIVEMKLVEAGQQEVARCFMAYRQEHKRAREDSPENLKILRRDGSEVRFKPAKIAYAIERAFRNTYQVEGATPADIVGSVNLVASKVVKTAMTLSRSGEQLHIELIQDQVEKALMSEGYFDVAKDYILYRSQRASEREQERVAREQGTTTDLSTLEDTSGPGQIFTVTDDAGKETTISEKELRERINYACRGHEELVDANDVYQRCVDNFYDGIRLSEINSSSIMAAKSKIESDPAYSQVAARLLLDVIYREVLGMPANSPELKSTYPSYFKQYIKKAVELERLNPALLEFDLDKLAKALKIERDDTLLYLGLQTLYDRYFIHDQDTRLEIPQIFWMRVAMGLSMNEGDQKNERAIEFYDVLSQYYFISSTPTLFNAGTTHPQLSSCYLSTVMDDLQHIFKVVSDDAQLSKWAGGLGNDWTNVRATGSRIKGTNGLSQGVIPFLKVANDTAVAVNQGGKRKGAMCAYLETWHLDIEDFLELRKNTGDERRRTHDMNTANWISDLFMKRVAENGQWTLFSPCDVPDLHDLYGKAFEERYEEYERKADRGEIELFKRVEAVALWRKMLGMVFETGHPWITFKDPSNIRSPQDHAGVVHSSNLCTEILLNTSKEETAVCNLGSVNLALHTSSSGLDLDRLQKTVTTAIRMLDNVIDINFYPTPEARTANLRHRPVGLGLMGFQDALYAQDISYASFEAVEFADRSMEAISYYAILASSQLAAERGSYETYQGSKWSRGLLPIDTIEILEEQRGGFVEVDTSSTLDWDLVRSSIKEHGMRNSNTMAIAPTATISNITGVTQSIEPMYKHLFVKSNLSGEFTITNPSLVNKLKELGIWDDEMVDDLKYFDGSIMEIERIPDEVKRTYVTAFEVEPEWLIDCASRRQKWIDMGQSLNLYISEPSGKRLHEMYMLAWTRGLKTTYYLRSLAATQIEKSTTDINKRGLQPRWMKSESASSDIKVQRDAKSAAVPVCNMEEGCESCQ